MQPSPTRSAVHPLIGDGCGSGGARSRFCTGPVCRHGLLLVRRTLPPPRTSAAGHHAL